MNCKILYKFNKETDKLYGEFVVPHWKIMECNFFWKKKIVIAFMSLIDMFQNLSQFTRKMSNTKWVNAGEICCFLILFLIFPF